MNWLKFMGSKKILQTGTKIQYQSSTSFRGMMNFGRVENCREMKELLVGFKKSRAVRKTCGAAEMAEFQKMVQALRQEWNDSERTICQPSLRSYFDRI
jgi:hypothetical protein